MIFLTPSVFNHYNRVHANFQPQSDLRYTEWTDQDERMSIPSIPFLRVSVPRVRNGPGGSDRAVATIPSA